ncbi:GNAT family N-acetyltransferase [Oceanobacillus piezotolerans]|uniref:GNAT family N-acetyltransferase n=1 Tax=Oceanobacillus piezotolerans TaxID=2448030 RepID=A0A498D6Q5_9BACI|nr:GNAT family N-acetyltransferase [Oceanobacillus piezotolerans]RLL43694.1 GNAT family N-acetyltransferase [Oceanobacillus piezotolerans]
MLTKDELLKIEILQEICEKKENIKLKLNWDMLHNRKEKESLDYLQYTNGELIAYLGIYHFGNKAEICGMVHPDYRRQGIFSKLLNKAIKATVSAGYKKILLNAPAHSTSARGLIQRLSCSYDMTEYQMKWTPIPLTKSDVITIRHSITEIDFNLEVELDVLCFGFSEKEAQEYNYRLREEEGHNFYIIVREDKAVGKIRVAYQDGEAWIYGFAIYPSSQGHGYGRKALMNIVNQEYTKGYDVYLEVEAKNDHALRLYKSCGFEVMQAQDYYLWN